MMNVPKTAQLSRKSQKIQNFPDLKFPPDLQKYILQVLLMCVYTLSCLLHSENTEYSEHEFYISQC